MVLLYTVATVPLGLAKRRKSELRYVVEGAKLGCSCPRAVEPLRLTVTVVKFSRIPPDPRSDTDPTPLFGHPLPVPKLGDPLF